MKTSLLFSVKRYGLNLTSPLQESCVYLSETEWSFQRRGELKAHPQVTKTTRKTNSQNSNLRTCTELTATKLHSVLTRQPIRHRSHQISGDKSSRAAANIELARIRLAVCFWLLWKAEFLQSFSFRWLGFVSFLPSLLSLHSSSFQTLSVHVCESVNYLPVQYPDLINRVNFFPPLPLPASSAAAAFSCRMRQTAAALRATVQTGVIQTNDLCHRSGCLAGPSSSWHIRSAVDQVFIKKAAGRPAVTVLVCDGVIAASAATQNTIFRAEVGLAKLKLVLWPICFHCRQVVMLNSSD